VSWSKFEASSSTVIELSPAGVLDVEVVDERSVPVPGVWIALRPANDAGAGTPLLERPSDPRGFGPSDAAGRVRIEELPAGIELSLLPVSSGTMGPSTAPVTATIAPSRLRGSVRIMMPTAGALTGTVVPPPAERERVEANFLPSRAPAKPAVASVDPAGTFRFERLPPGRGSLELTTIRLGSRATTSVSEPLDVEIVAGETTDLGRLELGRRAHIAGHVADWDGASSNDFLDVRCLRAGRLVARTAIDEQGRFELDLAPGACSLELVHMKRVLGAYPALAPDEDLELDPFAFAAGLRGRVPESAEQTKMFFPLLVPGDPASDGWFVLGKPTLGAIEPREGEFRMLFLEPGRYCFLAPFGELGAAYIPRLDLERGRELDLGRLTCGFGAVEGRVLGVDGAPVAAAELALESPFASVLKTHAPMRATTDAEGRFRLDSVPSGP
jgi:hypothetical protein